MKVYEKSTNFKNRPKLMPWNLVKPDVKFFILFCKRAKVHTTDQIYSNLNYYLHHQINMNSHFHVTATKTFDISINHDTLSQGGFQCKTFTGNVCRKLKKKIK